MEGISTNDEHKILTISNVAKDIFVAPTRFRIKSLNPNC